MKYIIESYNPGIELPNDPFHPFSPHEWAQHTPIQMRTYIIQHLPNPVGPDAVPSGPMSSTRATGYSTAALELMVSKRVLREK